MAQQDVKPDLDPNYLTMMVFLKECFEEVDFEKKSADNERECKLKLQRFGCKIKRHGEHSFIAHFLFYKLHTYIQHLPTFIKAYGRCSKILKTSCLPKRPGQTAQTKIRLSDQGLPCLLFLQAFVNSCPDNHFI